jgi:hypothetical protein
MRGGRETGNGLVPLTGDPALIVPAEVQRWLASVSDLRVLKEFRDKAAAVQRYVRDRDEGRAAT